MSNNGWIGVDFDATLAHYTSFVSSVDLGAPIPAMIDRVRGWIDEGWEVRIFTARCFSMAGEPEAASIAAVENWCRQHIGRVLPITNRKDWAMIELWDDRCVQVAPNTGEPVAQSTSHLKSEA